MRASVAVEVDDLTGWVITGNRAEDGRWQIRSRDHEIYGWLTGEEARRVADNFARLADDLETRESDEFAAGLMAVAS